jgi:hypothetical protein
MSVIRELLKPIGEVIVATLFWIAVAATLAAVAGAFI